METQQSWEDYWGDTYQQGRKVTIFSPLFQEMYNRGQLGKNIVDVGSGMWPMSSFLPEELGARIVSIDRAGGEHTYGERGLKIRFDLDDIEQVALVREKIAKVAKFLGVEESDSRRQIDCFVFSDVLNYVGYKKVLRFFKKYLKNGGRFILNEWPGRGYTNLHSENGLDSIENLYRLLQKEDFDIEHGPGIDVPSESIIVARLDA